MVFSKEEKQIWASSEVMRELERIAKNQSLETPDEAFLPIKEGQGWEDERSDEEKLMDAVEEFDEEDEGIDTDYTDEEYAQMEKEEKKRWENMTDEERQKFEQYWENLGKEVEKDNELARQQWKEHGPTFEQIETMEEMLPDEREEFKRMMEGQKEIESNLISGLTKLASYLGKQGKVVEASKVEDTIRDIRLTLREAKNG